MEHNDTEINDFSLGFINDDGATENFIEDGNTDDYSGSPGFEIVEEKKVNHGMLVSTRQVAETFFHKMVPSQTVQVQLNSVMANNHYVENAEAMIMIMEKQGSLLRKVKAYVMGKLIKPSMTIASAIVFIFALVLMHCAYLKEEVEIWNETYTDISATNMKTMRQSSQMMKWNESNDEVWKKHNGVFSN
ncbi:unnamed protein product [Sphenostylis stenocarpa]|uniref:Uncharacterized protein n=1 Tax=Sphenostylis stenocarpa TaxID=92480 RepID=A0AA86VRT2_9FABA|nr:unnamed protein product [Sphenostylis stenocarpa]